MPRIDLFSNIPPIGHLYFFYGLAFFFLGISILLKDVSSSDLKLAGSLWLLAGFGFAHGIHEWIELYLLLQAPYLSIHNLFWLKLATVSVVILSFLFLLQFGLSLLSYSYRNLKRWFYITPFILSLSLIALSWNYGFSMDMRFLERADVMSRHTFGLAGGLVTAFGLMSYASEVKNLSRHVAKKLSYAGVAFIIYGIFAGIVPSRILLPYIKIPVETVRGASAVFIAYFLIKALNIFDIETRKKLEQQLKRLGQSEKLVSLGQLAAGIAHEINNPLTNISLNVQILKDRLAGKEGTEIINRLDAIEKNVSKASNIAKELLQFSRKTEATMQPVEINSVIKGALTLMQYKFKDIVVHNSSDDMPDITGDPLKLEQVFINVLDNAAEAMPRGGEVRIECTCSSQWINVSISDSGRGIPKKDISKVFDPFYSTKEVGTGTGLGLSICYGIITQHGGDIEIESTVGRGTSVNIRLPVPDGEKGAIV